MVDDVALFLNPLVNLWFVMYDTNRFYHLWFPGP